MACCTTHGAVRWPSSLIVLYGRMHVCTIVIEHIMLDNQKSRKLICAVDICPYLRCCTPVPQLNISSVWYAVYMLGFRPPTVAFLSRNRGANVTPKPTPYLLVLRAALPRFARRRRFISPCFRYHCAGEACDIPVVMVVMLL